jgi:hypothetical protein
MTKKHRRTHHTHTPNLELASLSLKEVKGGVMPPLTVTPPDGWPPPP